MNDVHHTAHNMHEEEAPVVIDPREAAKIERQRIADEKEELRLEKVRKQNEASRLKLEEKERVRDEKYKQKQLERQAKYDAGAEERDAKIAAKLKEREEAKAKRDEEKAIEKAAKQEQMKGVREQLVADRQAESEAMKEQKAAELAAKAEERRVESEERKAAIEARRLAARGDKGRRAKSTHFKWTGGPGLAKPQYGSIRGKLLNKIKEHCPAGEVINIDEFGESELVKPHLYGTNIRQYIIKLEETGHIDFVYPEAETETAE